MAYTRIIENNFGQSMMLPQVCSGTTYPYTDITGRDTSIAFPGYTSSWYYADGVSSPLQWYNFSNLATQLATKKFYSEIATNLLVNSNDIELLESDQFKQDVETFNNNVIFIWGDFEKGGLCLCKDELLDGNTRVGYAFRLITGCYTNSDNSSYKFGINYMGSSSFRSDLLNNIAFAIKSYNDSSDIDEFHIFMCMNASNGWSYSVNWQSAGFITAPDCISATSNTDYNIYFDYLTPVNCPYKIWTFDTTYVLHLDTKLYTSLSGYSLYSGSPWGDNTSEDEDDPTASGGYSAGGGGFGNFPMDSDNIGDMDDSDFTLDCISTGLVTLYNPTIVQLQDFANFLYTGITDSIADQLKKLVTNPLDYIIFVALTRATPPTAGLIQDISFAGVQSGVTALSLSKQFDEIDCGTISKSRIESFKSFLDYEPHSKVQIHLPYCGTHELKMDDIQGGDLHLSYWIDFMTGSCVAKLRSIRSSRGGKDVSINSVLYEFNGNVYVTMPLTATDWRGAYNSLVQFVGGTVAMASGNVMSGVGSIASAVTGQKINLARSGQSGSSYGHMGYNYPYLILSRPNQSLPYQFKSRQGYTSNISEKLMNLQGFVSIERSSIMIDNIKASDDEKEMIKDLLEEGIYI